MSYFDAVIQTAVSESFLAAVNPHLVSRTLQSGRVFEIPSGRVFVDSSRRERCGVVVTGLARVFAVRPNGAQVTVRRVRRGGAIGIRALTGSANTLSVQALTDLEFLELDSSLLHRAAAANAELAWAIAQEVSRRLSDTERQIASVLGDSVAQRVAAALVDLVGDELPLSLSMSQEHLAEVVGASREQVGHVIRRLAGDEVLRISRRRVEVVDVVRLRALLPEHWPTPIFRSTS